MNLIKQFMKMGGFKSPQELETYGEENFFRDFPEAKKLAMGGTPEAFPQIATADQFFSYGVPVPPTYHRDGGATGLPNIYPQIQSEQQFFAPVYTNSNNAYKAGGSYGEAFPQAVSYPNHGWGKTNYFMLESGGSFPPGMPQYTGMLPVMQNGANLSGIDARTQQDMNHYYNAYPMMNGGQPSLQGGGEATENPDQSFYVNKMQNFISKLQQNGQKALMKSIDLVDENPPMSGMRWGGIPKYQSDVNSGQYTTEEASGAMMLDPNNPNYENNRRDQIGDYIFGDDGSTSAGTGSTTKGTGTSGGVSTSVAPAAKPAAKSTGTTKATAPTSGTTKPAAKSSSGTGTKARTQAELDAEIKAEKEKTGTSGTASSTTATGPTYTTETQTGQTTNTGTTADNAAATGWEGWRMVTLPDGRRVPVDSQNRVYFDNPYQSGPQYYNYGQPQQQNYGNFLDYIPGGGLRRKSANALLGYALSGVDLRDYVPTNVQTRRAILPGNRIKSFDLVKRGTGQGPYQTAMPTESAKTTQVPTIQDDGTFQSAMPTMTTDQKVQTANDWNYRPNQPSYVPAAPVIGPEGPVKQPSMMSTGDTGFDYSSFQQSNPNVAPNPVQDLTWDTGNGYADLMAEQARQIEKENDPFRTKDSVIPNLKIKRQGPFANLSADQMIAGMDSVAGILNKYGNWNQENMDFNTAMQVYGKSNARNSRGSYVTNAPGIGPDFRPDQTNANMRGMYAQYGGQGFYTGDNYYLTMPTIKNVKKAGAFKLGK